MSKENLKQALISVLVGACVAFFSTLFQGLADFVSSHSHELIAGMSSTAVYLAKSYRA